MKLVVTLALIITGASAFAQSDDSESVELRKGDQFLGLISEGKVLGVATLPPKCPKGAACSPRTIAKIELGLGGCMDHLGPVTATVDGSASSGFTILMTAVVVKNEVSRRARCIREPKSTVEVFLPVQGFAAPKARDIELIMVTGGAEVETKESEPSTRR